MPPARTATTGTPLAMASSTTKPGENRADDEEQHFKMRAARGAYGGAAHGLQPTKPREWQRKKCASANTSAALKQKHTLLFPDTSYSHGSPRVSVSEGMTNTSAEA